MFYPVESLRRGGRFYLCWVADSWPLRFATITQRQLWSQDIRELCDDLLQVMTQESGFASARFSLRLSSQLMRGLVRLYQRKVATFLGDLCMMNATVTKQINKKWVIHEYHEPTHRRDVQPRTPRVIITELLENEERVEERIQNSGNVVANIAEITLREAEIPEVIVTTDGFGEENPEQALALLNDRTLEQMLGQGDASLAQHSGDVPMLDVTEKSHDKTRMMACEVVMERISEVDLSMFRKSVDELMQNPDIEKQIPPTPEIPIPDMPERLPEKDKLEAPVQAPPPPQEPEPVAEKELELRLEELEEGAPRRRRRVKRLLVDRHIKITGAVLRERVENIMLELRCEDSTYDVIDHKRLPADRYLQRPACVGWRARCHVAAPLLHMFRRNLTVEHGKDVNIEAVLADEMSRARTKAAPTLDRIVEEEEPVAAPQPATDALGVSADTARFSSSVQQIEEVERAAAECDAVPAKKRRVGYASFRQSQQRATQELLMHVEEPIVPQKEQEPPITDTPKKSERGDRPIRSSGKHAQKRHSQDLPHLPQTEIPKEIDFPMQDNLDKHQREELHVSQMLEQAGLADGQMVVGRDQETRMSQPQRKRTSDGSETPLGSLDRTKVDLGESEVTTDAQRFLRKEWGTQGTMLKVVKLLNKGVRPLTVRVLVAQGPVPTGQQRLVAARCFTALLKLRKHNFINIKKDLETLEVVEISCGSKIRL